METITELRESCFMQWYNGKRTGIGSFEHSLYQCFFAAADSNRRKLKKAFPDFFNENDFEYKPLKSEYHG